MLRGRSDECWGMTSGMDMRDVGKACNNTHATMNRGGARFFGLFPRLQRFLRYLKNSESGPITIVEFSRKLFL